MTQPAAAPRCRRCGATKDGIGHCWRDSSGAPVYGHDFTEPAPAAPEKPTDAAALIDDVLAECDHAISPIERFGTAFDAWRAAGSPRCKDLIEKITKANAFVVDFSGLKFILSSAIPAGALYCHPATLAEAKRMAVEEKRETT